MKSLRLFLFATLLTASFERACAQTVPAPNPTPVEKTSFEEVTSQLDPGGELYLYLSTERFLKNLSEQISEWRDIVLANRNISASDRANAKHAFDLTSRLVKRSGLEEVSGVGASVIAREADLLHIKWFLHHYAGQGGDGLLWTALGSAPHPLDGLKLLPANTALANIGDLDLAKLWTVINEEVAESGVPAWTANVNAIPKDFEMTTGLSLDKVLASLDGQIGIVVTLDPAHTIHVPMGPAPSGADNTVELPSPAFALILRVKDDTIYKRFEEQSKQAGAQVIHTDLPESDLRMITIPVPNPILPTLRPSVARTGPYLILATDNALVTDMVAVLHGKAPGLTADSAEYKRLSQDVPTEGNAFQFATRAFYQTVGKLQQASLAQGHAGDPVMAAILEKLGWMNQDMSIYSVGAQTPHGLFVVANCTRSPKKPAAAVDAH